MELQKKRFGKGCVIHMYNIAVLGDRDSVLGFAALGLDIFPVQDAEQAQRQFRQLMGSSYAVIYVTEAAAQWLPEEIEKVRSQPIPAVILIPGTQGNTGEGMRSVHQSVEQAVGSDIL